MQIEDKIQRRWTEVSVACYMRACMCEDCPTRRFFIQHHCVNICKMKEAVIALVRQHGKPDNLKRIKSMGIQFKPLQQILEEPEEPITNTIEKIKESTPTIEKKKDHFVEVNKKVEPKPARKIKPISIKKKKPVEFSMIGVRKENYFKKFLEYLLANNIKSFTTAQIPPFLFSSNTVNNYTKKLLNERIITTEKGKRNRVIFNLKTERLKTLCKNI